GMAITCYGTSVTRSLAELVIEGNVVHDCDPAPSEAIVLNGNVERFVVQRNDVSDVNNIGIDMIGGETSINPAGLVARFGVCRANYVARARHKDVGTPAAGIYVDGGRDIVIEANVVTECNIGIEVGAENRGVVATRVVVRSNVSFGNDDSGLAFGGYDKTVGIVRACDFYNNTLYANDRRNAQLGEILIQNGDGNRIFHNVIVANSSGLLLTDYQSNTRNTIDENVWFAPGGASRTKWNWDRKGVSSFAEFQRVSGQAVRGQFADPLFVDASRGDFRLQLTSPALDAAAASSKDLGLDVAGMPRLQDGKLRGALQVDLGAHEFAHAQLAIGGELRSGKLLRARVSGTSGLP
ncbi:MAG TPA: right-handed parallel beta-helix repeat-containing protein, partial [Planctomycetota bacterium]|nr:right-handed parallel beta-helix repeat-containing protein [Planctomycetota bacterium]